MSTVIFLDEFAQKYSLVQWHWDGSGLLAAWGVYDSEAEAEAVGARLKSAGLDGRFSAVPFHEVQP